MSNSYINCPNCYAKQGIDLKFCGLCGVSLKSRFQIWKELFISNLPIIKNIAIISAIILILWQFLFPAPYNPSYLAKRIFYKPTAICRDGVYSFSASRSGTCSNHGGVKTWIRK